jgi:hypothetical protein
VDFIIISIQNLVICIVLSVIDFTSRIKVVPGFHRFQTFIPVVLESGYAAKKTKYYRTLLRINKKA